MQNGKGSSGSKVSTIDDVVDGDPEVQTQRVTITDHGDNFSGDKVELTIHQGEGEVGGQPVFLQVNGANVLIPRGIKVEIADELKHALDNAVYTVYECAKDGSTKAREVKRFNYTVHKFIPAADVAPAAPAARAKK
jgi:hypothetical protein